MTSTIVVCVLAVSITSLSLCDSRASRCLLPVCLNVRYVCLHMSCLRLAFPVLCVHCNVLVVHLVKHSIAFQYFTSFVSLRYIFGVVSKLKRVTGVLVLYLSCVKLSYNMQCLSFRHCSESIKISVSLFSQV